MNTFLIITVVVVVCTSTLNATTTITTTTTSTDTATCTPTTTTTTTAMSTDTARCTPTTTTTTTTCTDSQGCEKHTLLQNLTSQNTALKKQLNNVTTQNAECKLDVGKLESKLEQLMKYGASNYTLSKHADLLSGLQIIQTSPWVNKKSCADLCTPNPACAGFVQSERSNVVSCVVLDRQPMGKHPYVYKVPDLVYLREGKIEILAFRTSGQVTDSPHGVINGIASTGHVTTACDLDTKLGKTFKHPIMERWTDLPISQVKLSLRDPDASITNVVFDATFSDKLSWMQKNRLMESPWSDLAKTTTTNYFGVNADSTHRRRFLINNHYGGCLNDYGWLCVSEKPVCSWEKRYPKLPAIIYSKESTNVSYERGANVGEATDMFLLAVINIQ